MIPRLVPETSPFDGFCDGRMDGEEELGVLLVGFGQIHLATWPGTG